MSARSQEAYQLPALSRSFAAEQMRGFHEVWAITSDPKGRIFVGTKDGISVFDGEEWELYETATGTTVRSLALGQDGRIYVGQKGDIGVMKPDSLGALTYISLLEEVAYAGGDFSDVWEIHALQDETYFQTSSGFMRYNGEELEVIESEAGVHTSFRIGDRLIARERGVGLVEVIESSTSLLEGGDFFSEMRVFVLFEQTHDRWLVGTRDNGFFQYNPTNGAVKHMKSEADSVLRSAWLYGGVELAPHKYALATLGEGMVIIDHRGNLINHYRAVDESGDQHIQKLHVSHDGSLWIGKKSSGVTVTQAASSLLRIGEKSGITGVINGIHAAPNNIRLSSSSGLYTAIMDQRSSRIQSSFVPHDSVVIAWDYSAFLEGDLVASDDGLWYYATENVQKLINGQTFTVVVDPIDTRVVWAGTKSGVMRVSYNGHLVETQDYQLKSEIREIRFDETKSRLWAIAERDSVFKISVGSDRHLKEVRAYPVESSKMGDGIVTAIVDGQLSYAAGRAIVTYNSFSEDFVELDLGLALTDASQVRTSVLAFTQAPSGDLWIALEDSVAVISTQFSGVGFRLPSALRFGRSSTSSILADSTGVVWFNNGSELIRYDPKYDVTGQKVFNAHIASVKTASDGEPLFGGFYRAPHGGIADAQPDWSIPTLDFEQRNLTFQFSATEFINPEAVQYRYRVDGSEPGDWTEWSDEREVLTASLDEGAYAMVVQAKDEIGRLSTTASYRFVILPPWYRTLWAYLAYFVLGGTAIVSGRKYLLMRRSHKMATEQAKELEREREVVKKLSEANDRLLQANKLKDEFLATTSHELRTPLTAILGFTSVLKDEIPQDADYREFLDIIEDSGSRLMDTLNSLLDLAKLRAGIMEINIEAVDVYQVSFQEVVQLQTAAQKKGLNLKVRRPEQPLYAQADVYGLNRVLHNLVGNAVKFTDEGRVEVWFEERADRIDIHITDTGIGIDAEFLPELFNAFIQESDGLARTHEGTGLGLAITSGIVGLMDASIRVESTKGKGSDFVVSLEKADAPRKRSRRFLGMGNTASA